MMKTIAIVVRNFPGYDNKAVWFPVELDMHREGACKEAEKILLSSGIDVSITHTEDLRWVEKHNYTRI